MEGAGDGQRHRGFGFVTFSQNEDALDAIDNMHLNELDGRVSPIARLCSRSFMLRKMGEGSRS